MRRAVIVLGAATLAAVSACGSAPDPDTSADTSVSPPTSTTATSTTATSAGTAAPKMCDLISWSDLPKALRPTQPQLGQVSDMPSSVYPDACVWRVFAPDKTMTVQLNIGYRSGAPGPEAAGAKAVTVAGHNASIHEAAWGSGEPYCQGGIAVPELKGSLDMLLTNAGVPGVKVCEALVELYGNVVDQVA